MLASDEGLVSRELIPYFLLAHRQKAKGKDLEPSLWLEKQEMKERTIL
jgi:hypothetical protein